jgi:hypothetical protein
MEKKLKWQSVFAHDAIGFINGLPLVFIELKRFEVYVDSAYKKNFSDLAWRYHPTTCPRFMNARHL